MNEQHDNSNQQAWTPSPVDPVADEAWLMRIGQIETVLRFFGSLCSVSIDRSAGNGPEAVTDDVYVQAQRADDGIELEMTGPQFLTAGDLTDRQVSSMIDRGWTAPDAASPNFTRLLTEEVELHDVAVDVARAFSEVYGVRPDAAWVVSPPEFGNVDAGLAPFDVLDLDGEEDAARTPAEELSAARRRILREASGAQLLAVVESAAITWADLVEAGLPRGDRRAEVVMLYRHDCPLEFLRASRFHPDVLTDAALPISTAQSILKAEPTAMEIDKLSRRTDLPRTDLASAAVRAAKLANWRGRSGSMFLKLGLVPIRRLTELSAVQDADAAGMLRHPRCPEDIVLHHILSRSANVRYLALLATKRRGLAIDSAIIRLTKQVPMSERPNIAFPYAERARALAEAILEDR